MDCVKTGALIRRLRLEKKLTQAELGELIHVGNKAVSKWERGMGCPDISVLAELSRVLGAETESLLSGETDNGDRNGGNMNRLKFYVCPVCGNVITTLEETAVACCGRKLEPLVPVKAEGDDRLNVEHIENDYFITGDHPMTKAHYISFVALVSGDGVMLKKLYPEWDLSARVPCFARGKLYYYCNQHGLFYQLVS